MILLSGGFDPVHPGHLRMIQAATKYGAVCIALNSDRWLKRKKGFFFQPWTDRAHILRSVRWVSSIEPVDDADGTVCQAIERLRPNFFGNGGDRTKANTPELDLCKELGIKPVFGLGGEKFASSSTIGARAVVDRCWGGYTVLDDGPGYKVKRLEMEPHQQTSLQCHAKRAEIWVDPATGEVQQVAPGEWHCLENPADTPLTMIEIQIGDCEESDIERK